MSGYIDAGQPNATLYVQNLNERISPNYLIPELKSIFSEYGEVTDVIVKKRLALRGQAFIIFNGQDAARKALESLQGDRIYGKSMVIRYAKYKSDIISKADGTYEIEKRRREQDRIEKARQPRMTRRQLMAQMAANPMMQGGGGMPGGLSMGMSMGMPMGVSMGMLGGMPISTAGPNQMTMGSGGELQLPNKVLYLQNLPEGIKESQLSELFKRFPGFIEVRMVPNRPDVAFAEYENEMQAMMARQSLDGHEVTAGSPLRVAFAKR